MMISFYKVTQVETAHVGMAMGYPINPPYPALNRTGLRASQRGKGRGRDGGAMPA